MTALPSSRGRGAALATATVLACIGAGVGLASNMAPRLQAMALGVVFIAVCAFIIARYGFGNGRRDLFSPLILITAYHALGVGLKGVVDLGTGESKIGHALDPMSLQFAKTMAAVFAYAILGILALALGDRLARRKENSQQLRCPFPLLDVASLRGAVGLSVLLTLFGASILVAKFGVIVLTDPSFIAVQGTIGLFWLYPLMYASIYGWALLIIDRWSAGLRARNWQMAAMVGTSLIVYLLTSSKASLITTTLVLVIGRHRAVRPVRFSLMLGLAASFLIALPLLYLHREYGFTADSLSRITPGMALAGAQIFFGRSYLADSFAAVLLYTPRVYPFRLGSTWLELFYFWVPRSWWPGKPLSQSLEFGHTYMSSYYQHAEGYYSSTLLGDAYMNFGPIGIILLFMVLGYLLRRWYWWLMGPDARPETVMLFAASAYWLAMGAEQALAVLAGLALSYVAIAALLSTVAREGYLSVGART